MSEIESMASEIFNDDEYDQEDISESQPSENALSIQKLRGYGNSYEYQLFKINKILEHKRLTSMEKKALRQRKNTTQYRLTLARKDIRKDFEKSFDNFYINVSVILVPRLFYTSSMTFW